MSTPTHSMLSPFGFGFPTEINEGSDGTKTTTYFNPLIAQIELADRAQRWQFTKELVGMYTGNVGGFELSCGNSRSDSDRNARNAAKEAEKQRERAEKAEKEKAELKAKLKKKKKKKKKKMAELMARGGYVHGGYVPPPTGGYVPPTVGYVPPTVGYVPPPTGGYAPPPTHTDARPGTTRKAVFTDSPPPRLTRSAHPPRRRDHSSSKDPLEELKAMLNHVINKNEEILTQNGELLARVDKLEKAAASGSVIRRTISDD